jgi:hypothetical protein
MLFLRKLNWSGFSKIGAGSATIVVKPAPTDPHSVNEEGLRGAMERLYMAPGAVLKLTQMADKRFALSRAC